jgi:hypothetical protein
MSGKPRSNFLLSVPDKNKFFPQLFCLLLPSCIFTSVFQDTGTGNKLLRSHKTVEVKVFPIALLVDGRILINYCGPDSEDGFLCIGGESLE